MIYVYNASHYLLTCIVLDRIPFRTIPKLPVSAIAKSIKSLIYKSDFAIVDIALDKLGRVRLHSPSFSM